MHMPHALLRMLVAWDLNDLLLYNMLLFDIDLQIFSCDGGCSCCPFFGPQRRYWTAASVHRSTLKHDSSRILLSPTTTSPRSAFLRSRLGSSTKILRSFPDGFQI